MTASKYLRIVVACSGLAFLVSPATSKPVTTKDWPVGKKVCWNTSNAPFGTPPGCVNDVWMYYPGGKFHSTCWGNGTCQGNNCDSETGKFAGHAEKLPDGTFKSTTVFQGVTYESTGHYCQ